MNSNIVQLQQEVKTGIDTCELHGDYQTKIHTLMGKEFRSACPECSAIAKAEAEAKATTEMAITKRVRIEEKMGSALVPKRFQGKKFNTYKVENTGQQKALDACRSYAEEFKENLAMGRCLILCGQPGTGKTHLATAIADYLITETKYTAVYRSLFSILQSVKNTYGKDSEHTERQVFRDLERPDLLIIDEIGATKSTEFELATLFALINARYENQLPTLIISNLEPDELKGAIGERCVDRLREGGGKALSFGWDSMRSKIGAAS
ncbi:MAG: ATP-binding protein [Pseudomonas sp.]|jgi:DNA replication protein DnaC|nr:ATP-binding protein [Pseudomonas sp.]